MPTYRPGDRILNKKYVVEKLLGLGGFGEVYLCKHIDLQVLRAIKLVHRGLPGIGSTVYEELFSRFQQEARIGASFQHDHLIQVYDFEQIEDALFLVMEYATGGSLRERISEKTTLQECMQIEEALQIIKSIANGLAALHQRQIIHRDLKPSNILFSKDRIVKVADLGLAQIPGGMSQRSRLGSMVEFQHHPGTPDYMSPEQREKFTALQPPSDIYAVGLIFFEMLTGKNPYYLEPGTRIRSERLDVDEELSELIQSMLEEDPRKRPWDAKRLLERLENFGKNLKPIPETREKINANQTSQLEIITNANDVQREIKASEPQDGEIKLIDLGEQVYMEFVNVPAGEFWMGSDENDQTARADEKPKHRVYLDEYWIGKYPVTNRQYAWFINETNHKKPEHWNNEQIPFNKEDHPVVFVSWYDAERFSKWLNQKCNKSFKLPSEAQWEKAARGKDGRRHPWGNESPQKNLLNYNMNVGDTTPVSSYPQGASPYGVMDMAGNVWEWVWDWYENEYYKRLISNNPKGPKIGEFRVARGGSWFYVEFGIRSTLRYWVTPSLMRYNFGFRIVISD